jgi:diguanylate cyclase (GGDEF)-like protein
MVQIHLNSNGIKLIQIAELMIFFISSMRLFELYQSNFQQLQGKLLEQAYKDELSNLLNRHSLIEIGSNIIRKSVILNQKTSVMFLDIDNFKAINDKLGHTTGDKTIEWISNVIEAHITDTGIAGRYGGEEFVLIYPNTNEQEALIKAEALREHICRSTLEFDHSSNIGNTSNSSQKNTIHITVSIGIASQKNSIESLEKLIERADKALYQAKKSGKNRCKVFQPAPSQSSITSRFGDHTLGFGE